MTQDEKNQRQDVKPTASVRRSDIEPYTALRWVGTLFKAAAVFLGVAIIGEFMAGLRFEGTRAVPILMGELARTAVLAVVMWGAGDLVRLLITVGNDVRAERILLARLVYRTPLRQSDLAELDEGEELTEGLTEGLTEEPSAEKAEERARRRRDEAA